MSFTPKQTVVKRQENLNYASWGTMDKPVLAGTGITDWSEDLAPVTDDGQYINEANQHSNLLGYLSTVSYVGELIPENAFVMHVYEVGKKKLVGETFIGYEVETWAPVGDDSGEFACHKNTYEIQPANPGSGEGGGKINMEGKFSQKGDTVHGKFNIVTGIFVEGDYDYATATFKAAAAA